MAKYNKLERQIAKVLEKMPWLRELIKFFYKRIIYLVYRKSGFSYELSKGYSLDTPYSMIGKLDEEEEALFFGYYDKSPWNEKMSRAVFHSCAKNSKEVYLKLFDFEKNDVEIVGQTSTWNWQQGAMTQWLNNNEIIFNSEVKKGHLGSQIVDVRSSESRSIDFPIQCIRPDGKQGISLNYKRLMKLRPDYGYQQEFLNFCSEMPYDEDGLWVIDLEKNEASLVITLQQLYENVPTAEMSITEHKVNHVMYSPDGESIIFLHRWLGKVGKWSRLYLYSFKTARLEILLDNKMVSHYSWKSNKEIVAWARFNEIDGYYHIDAETKVVSEIANRDFDLFGDGHPSCHPLNKKVIISDSYPDKSRIRALFTANLDSNKLRKVGDFYSPWKFENEKRCDLHPRWSPDGKMISIDSAHTGKRKTYFLR
ncbi:hypothetical protein [Ekhidna sp.]|uniref:hypothetical protein n=1 Tax=Ekhidna sp. TaxID=2608089 RepID=UPI003C799B1D